MPHLLSLIGWFFGGLFALLTASMLLQRNVALSLVLALLVLLCLPVGPLLVSCFGVALRPAFRGAAIAGLLVVFGILITRQAPSIYKTAAVRDRLLEIYSEKMAAWPVAFEDVFLDTEYGRVHVVVSGPREAPPLLLLHASGVSSWSWIYNIEELSRHYRCYAIDLIGDAGRSEYANLAHVLKSGRDQADLYADIADQLGVDRAFVVGASEGGFIATNYALHYPQRVRKLALLGPMGYAGATQAIVRITIAQLFPLRAIQERTFAWAFSDSAPLRTAFGEWFRLVMSGMVPAKVPPWPFSAEDRRRLTVPVLFVFGTRDHLVGDPTAATALVQDIPDVQVRVIQAGHLMGAEAPAQVNALLAAFLTSDRATPNS